MDETGLILSIALGLLAAFFSYRMFKNLKDIREEDQAYAPPLDASVDEKVTYYKKILYISLIVFPSLSIIVILDLNSLESGEAATVRTWALVAFIYEQFGYWAAILAAPVLGVLVVAGLLRTIRLLRSENKA
ncbi:hypothetical protein EHQ53_12230 [Leptospira langatensis]|uniref:Uncharacterized protein n=1 Tax=Leptospira langatensis TaxID=2484983 RepID=A0A5F1ZUZ0_9LEPT|nr:hypothetical protein [Leptospira langatensis]TGJ98691.1 hypothetical protein EHO57_14275 [Leptospira langatensis]TGL40743.1 hypothetical protein EHQ53_12230 [Leptospira langatensis]